MKRYITEKSKEFHEEIKEYLVDGVGSYFHLASYQEYLITVTH